MKGLGGGEGPLLSERGFARDCAYHTRVNLKPLSGFLEEMFAMIVVVSTEGAVTFIQ